MGDKAGQRVRRARGGSRRGRRRAAGAREGDAVPGCSRRGQRRVREERGAVSQRRPTPGHDLSELPRTPPQRGMAGTHLLVGVKGRRRCGLCEWAKHERRASVCERI